MTTRPAILRPAALRIHRVKARELSAAQQLAWAAIQETEIAFQSPFFRPEFTLLAASTWDRVCVGVLELDGVPVGFFPFESSLTGIARPVASLVSDYQGVVVRSGTIWSVEDLLRGCRLIGAEFNHLVASQGPWQPHHVRVGKSPLIDLSSGYEAYREARLKAFRSLERRHRQLEKEIGPLRFVADQRDSSALEWLVQRKSKQCAEKGYTDALTIPGIRRLVDAIHVERTPGFAGMLSVLYVGDRILAAHMGMRSKNVWHYWFPVYDEELGKYSPGLLLLMQMAQAAAGLGLRKIDLGKGDSLYKARFANDAVDLAEASAEAKGLRSVLVRAIARRREQLREASWSAPLRRVYRRIVYR